MVDKRPSNEIVNTEPTFEMKVFEAVARARDSWRKNQTLWSVALAVAACAAGAWSFWAWKTKDAENEASRILGLGMVHQESERTDSALAAFDRVVADHSGLAASKASLLAGSILMGKADWKGAEQRFRRAIDDANALPLLDGGARRGLAAALIEQGRFEEAAKELQTVVSRYGHISVEVKNRDIETGPSDDLPFIPLTYLQLVLVQDKLGKKADAQKNAEHLIRAYPTSEEANEARRWLALNGLAYPA
jgi:hypothetical protein